MSYKLENGQELPDVDGTMVGLVYGVINFYGGAAADSVRPEEAVARGCQTLISYLKDEQARRESRAAMESLDLRVSHFKAMGGTR